MSDYLVELGKNPRARSLVKSLGLPIPMPQSLERAKGPSVERPLDDLNIAVYTNAGSDMSKALGKVLAKAGANPFVWGNDALASFAEAGEAFGRPATAIEVDSEGNANTPKLKCLVLDGTALADSNELGALYDFFHPMIHGLGRCGRVVVIGRPTQSSKSASAAGAQAALEGFVRSIAKEVGKKGATAQLLRVAEGAEENIAGPLRFILSARSAYVSGQPIGVSATTGVTAGSTPWVCPLEGKVALVTGAARGIGAATARLMALEGAHVVCLDRPGDEEACSKLAREIGGSVLMADVTSEDAPEVICKALQEAHGGVDVVVHNAGVTRDKTIARMKRTNWDMAIDVNLGAVTRITEALLEGTMREGGRFIFLSSIAGIAGNMGQTNYSASKAGVIGLVRFLETKLADQGITANAIAPGFIETRLTAAIPFMIREAARRMNNLGQGGLPDDVAQAINFLASPGAQGLNGQVIRVCGGSLVGA